MSRLSAFREELKKEIGWGDFQKKAEGVRKLMAFVAWLFGIVGYSIKDATWLGHWPKLEPWSPALLAVLVWFIAWKFGRVWERTSGPPRIEPEPPHFDGGRYTDLPIRNAGGGQVFARAFATDLFDDKGVRLPNIGSEIQLCWRGPPYLGDMELVGSKRGRLLLTYTDQNGTQMCGVCASDQNQISLAPVPKGGRMRLAVRIEFVDRTDKHQLTEKLIEFWIAQDANPTLPCQIQAIT